MTGQEKIDSATATLSSAIQEKLNNSSSITSLQDSYNFWVNKGQYPTAHTFSDKIPSLEARNSALDIIIAGANSLKAEGTNDLILEAKAKQLLVDAETARINALPTNQQADALAQSKLLGDIEASKAASAAAATAVANQAALTATSEDTKKYWIIGGSLLFVAIVIGIVIYIKR